MAGDETFEEKELRVLGGIKFPDGFNDAGGKTFKVVYDTLKDFVYFTRHWEKVTGLFKHWRRYVELRDQKDKVQDERPILKSEATNGPVLDLSPPDAE